MGRAAREGAAWPRANRDPWRRLPGGWGGGGAWGLERALPPGRRQCGRCVPVSCEGPPPRARGCGRGGRSPEGQVAGLWGRPGRSRSWEFQGSQGKAGPGLVGRGPPGGELASCGPGVVAVRTGLPWPALPPWPWASSPVAPRSGFSGESEGGCPSALGTPPTYTQVVGGLPRPGSVRSSLAFSSACFQALGLFCLCCSEASSELW